MPRLTLTVPKYRKHKGSGQAVVTLNGRDHYLGQHGTKASKRKYRRLIDEWEENDRRPFDSAEQPPTIIEICKRYLDYATNYYRASDPKNRSLPGVKLAIRYMRENYGPTLARDFGPLALKALRKRMIADGLSRTYINDHVGRIVRMFRWAVGEQIIPVEVYQALAIVPGLRRGRCEARETEPILPVDDSTVDATLPHLPAIVADMVRVQRLTGCRPAELCTIRPCDVDRSGDVWKYRPRSHKSEHRGRERLIFIGPKAQEILLRYLVRDSEANCFRPCDSEAKRRAAATLARRTPLSCGNVPGRNRKARPARPAGECYSVDSYRRAIQRACDAAFSPDGDLAQRAGETAKQWYGRLTAQQRAELAKWRHDHRWSPNQLRHSAATEIRQKHGLEAAQAVLGHARADVTQIYAERDFALAASVVKQIG